MQILACGRTIACKKDTISIYITLQTDSGISQSVISFRTMSTPNGRLKH